MYSSIQDFGRVGFRKYGVPVSGVMDQYSASLANILVNNPVNCPLMEITMSGPKLKFNTSAVIAISGADISPIINNAPVKLNQMISIQKGTILSFGKLNFGCRAYLSVKGGFETQISMCSYSMYHGITKDAFLKKGNILTIQPNIKNQNKTYSLIKVNDNHFNNHQIEVFQGPEFHWLRQNQKDNIFNSNFIVSSNINRMGYQLDNPNLSKSFLSKMLTSSIIPGTVQLTPSGKIIILMRDCQTTGGYPRILQLTENSINKIAQKKTGDSIIFKLKS